MAKIITTREIFVHLSKGPRNLERTTTKHVDASIKVVQPKNPQKPVTLSTANLPDVQDIIDKKKRDDIMAERKLYLKDQKKLTINEKGEANKAFEKGDAVYQEKKEEKKPWKDMTEEERHEAMEKQMQESIDSANVNLEKKVFKDMTDKEKKIEYKKRAQRAKATREAKKEKK